jgi:uncharacterized protein
MKSGQAFLIPAGRGVARHVNQGQTVKVINTHGSQVVDFWAFNAEDLGECMSMEHTHTALGRIVPKVGDVLVTNRRSPILTVVEDTSPGAHDTLIASCDRFRYQQLGCTGHHDNCTDNLAHALGALGLERLVQPCPFNLFQNTPVRNGVEISWEAPLCKPGDAISFRVEMDAVIAFSACPQDLLPVNGIDCVIHDAHFEIN